MPVFDYLSEEEAADVYLYLTRYPPYRWATLDSEVATAQSREALDASPQLAGVSYIATTGATNTVHTTANTNPKLGLLPVLTGLVVLALMLLGFGFTVFELKRLPVRNSARRKAARSEVAENIDQQDRELVA